MPAPSCFGRLLAISLRCSGVSFAARAFPPFFPHVGQALQLQDLWPRPDSVNAVHQSPRLRWRLPACSYPLGLLDRLGMATTVPARMATMFYLKSTSELETMRRGGQFLSEVVAKLAEAVTPGVTTGQLDTLADELIRAAGGIPSAKGYQGFPGAICTSPNEVVVHGIPGETVLREGDNVSLDVAMLYQGYHVDMARTFPVGTISPRVQRLMDVTERSLTAAIRECQPGARVGDLGAPVQGIVEGEGFSVVRNYSGHGVGRSFHEEPHIFNYGKRHRGTVLKPGMTLAIEPMVIEGRPETRVLDDGWSVVAADGSMAAHFEHTVAIIPEGCEVLTRPQ